MERGSILGRYPERMFLVLTVGLSVLVFMVPAPDEGTLLGLLLIATILPTAVAIALEWLLGGRAGAGRFIRQCFAWRSPLLWYVIAVVLAFVIQLGSSILALATGAISSLQLQAPVAVVVVFILFALLEEIGWRGFALRRLLLRTPPFVAALVVGIGWAAVHFALALFTLEDISPIAEAASILAFSFPLTWVFARSGGSVIVATVMHFVFNASGSAVGPSPVIGEGDGIWYLAASMVIGAVLIVVADRRWWFGAPAPAPVLAPAA